MRVLGQRWEYRIGNSVVFVDNAFSWLGYGQERLLVNDEVAQQAGGWFALRRDFREGWITRLGEGEMQARLTARMRSIACTVRLDNEVVEPASRWRARWNGPRGSWPLPADWQEVTGDGHAIAF